MNFTKIGFIAVSTLVTIGTGLWYTRTDNRIQPQDQAELMNAVQERCLATRFMTNSPTDAVISDSGEFSVVKASDDTHSFYVGTNPVPYSVPGLVPVAPYTNTLISSGGNIACTPVAFPRTFTENDKTNRWILGTYESFDVSDLTVSEFNGTYWRVNETFMEPDGTWIGEGYYTNAGGVLLVYDETGARFDNGGGFWDGVSFEMDFPPWFNAPLTEYPGGFGSEIYPVYMTCTRGALASNTVIELVGTNYVTNAVPAKIIDRPCYRKTYTYDWTIDPRAPRWGDFFGRVDLTLWGGYNSGPGYPSSRHTPSGPGLWYQGLIYYSNAPPIYEASIHYNTEGVHFINSEKWGSTTFSNISELYLPVETWGLTNTTNIVTLYGYTGTLYGFDDSIIVPMGLNSWTDFRNSPDADQLRKHAFDQRRTALQQCTVLRAHPGYWIPPAVSNNVRSGSAYSTNSYAEACSLAKAACTNLSTSPGEPYSYAVAQLYDSTPKRYIVSMQSRDARLVAFFDTNNTCEVSTYLKAAPNAYGSVTVTNRFFANDTSVTFTTNQFTLVDTSASGRYLIFNGITVSNLNNVFPPAPITNVYSGGNKTAGYTLEDSRSTEIITKWDFQYCKP